MSGAKNWMRKRVLLGGLLGAVLTPLTVWLLGLGMTPGELAAAGSFDRSFGCVTAAMAETFGSPVVAAAVQSVLGGLFGGVVALASLPFADDGRDLVVQSLGHFAATAGTFALLLWVCRWVNSGWYILFWVGMLAVLYVLVWLGRWIGWYMEVVQIRTLLGLDPGPSFLNWKETTPYLPFAALVCIGLPLVLRGMEKLVGVDVPVLTGLLLPYVILPVVGFLSGVSLGKRQGVCPLYPVACFVFYLPMVWLLYNSSAIFHCYMVAVPAAAGNVLGWMYRRAVPKRTVR